MMYLINTLNNFIIISVSEKIYELLGYNSTDLINKSLKNIIDYKNLINMKLKKKTKSVKNDIS